LLKPSPMLSSTSICREERNDEHRKYQFLSIRETTSWPVEPCYHFPKRKEISAMTKVSNVAPEQIELFHRAAQEEIRVRLPSHGQAVHLRQRLYMLRQAMRDEKHPLTPIAEGVSFSIVQDSSDGADTDTEATAYLIAR